MTSYRLDPHLLLAWQTAHAIGRGSRAPVHDRGGFRVDTGSEKEVKRWVFPELCDGLSEIAREIVAPRHYLKLCGTDEELHSVLPARWQMQPSNHFMTTATASLDVKPLPDGYRMEVHPAGAATRVHIIAPNGDLAASGCAAETADVFIYDRIETSQDHRRKGLGIAVMAALAAARKSTSALQLLAATGDGRKLYENLGWRVIAPFAAATIPD